MPCAPSLHARSCSEIAIPMAHTLHNTHCHLSHQHFVEFVSFCPYEQGPFWLVVFLSLRDRAINHANLIQKILRISWTLSNLGQQ